MKDKIAFFTPPEVAEQIAQIHKVIRCIEDLRRVRDSENRETSTIRENFNKAIAALNNLVVTLAEQAQNPKIQITEDGGK